jgi:ribosomal protein L16 Arg81 hydroxylase
MFGGTPEALALEKAIAEQQAGTAVDAMGQARAEQAQFSTQRATALDQMLRENMAATQSIPNLLQGAYTPQEGLLNALSPSVDLSRIQSALQAGGTEAVSNLGIQGLTTQTNLESFINAQRQQQLQGLFDLLSSGQQNTQNTFSIPSTLAELFGPRP